jgi:hypothetical protein
MEEFLGIDKGVRVPVIVESNAVSVVALPTVQTQAEAEHEADVRRQIAVMEEAKKRVENKAP